MKLTDNFFTTLSTEKAENKIKCKVKFNAGHDIFHAHFPRNPITPGVCLVKMVEEILESMTNTTLCLREANNIKFRQMISPNVEPLFVIKTKQLDTNNLHANVSVEDGETQYVKMSLEYLIS